MCIGGTCVKDGEHPPAVFLEPLMSCTLPNLPKGLPTIPVSEAGLVFRFGHHWDAPGNP